MYLAFKVENISKDSLVLIPSTSPSLKIQIIYERESLLEAEMQNISGHYQQIFEDKKFFDITQKWFTLLSQVNYPANNSNFQ